MDLERIPEPRLSERRDLPVETDLAPVAEPDADFAVAYAAWRLDRKEDAR